MKKMGADSIGGGGGKSGCLSAIKNKMNMDRFQIGQIHRAYHAHRLPSLKAVSVIEILRMDKKMMLAPVDLTLRSIRLAILGLEA
jgi:hypothetical protein